eukprot:gnl/TRDRNA2_/TRDRNA2_176827_c1_seq4.p1 gnl/TRDRNA2_/TRDRNA2_176827_c1~~gnl/TRDRNA2_/TRDRNA2_176827_c1_seq4.p1  ORF type:complete len:124 (-),score=9.91 gnl/TRDRNA2_/TRDRNA2_176827_c1_seq4:298-669(-)
MANLLGSGITTSRLPFVTLILECSAALEILWLLRRLDQVAYCCGGSWGPSEVFACEQVTDGQQYGLRNVLRNSHLELCAGIMYSFTALECHGGRWDALVISASPLAGKPSGTASDLRVVRPQT